MYGCKWEKNIFLKKGWVILLLLVFFSGTPAWAGDPVPEKALKKITAVSLKQEKGMESILISSPDKLTYTDVKKLSPMGVIFYFPDTVLAEGMPEITSHSPIIKGIKSSVFKENNTSRIEIQLAGDLHYKTRVTGQGLEIIFDKHAAPQTAHLPAKAVEVPAADNAARKAAVQSTGPSMVLQSVNVSQTPQKSTVNVVAGTKIKEFISFPISEPPRIVFDVFNMKSGGKGEKKIHVNDGRIKRVRYFSYPERVRIVIDTEKRYLASFSSSSTEDGLMITIEGPVKKALPIAKTEPVEKVLPIAQTEPVEKVLPIAQTEPVEKALPIAQTEPVEKALPIALTEPVEKALPIAQTEPVKKALPIAKTLPVKKAPTQAENVARKAQTASRPVMKAASSPAVIDLLEFESGQDGSSLITIGTSAPVSFEEEKAGDKVLNINLFGVKVPDYRKRQMITTRFDSAVNRILPVQSSAMKDSALIMVELRESVPYSISQSGNRIMVRIEPSSIPPKPMTAARPDWQKAMDKKMPGMSVESAPESFDPLAQDTGSPIGAPGKVYTGEKISLDFYETDIKNVFRILQSVSGKNFAIDKNVTGKVTLNLDKPVPWDQILDLVLKMNGLGMLREGDIVRIATQATIKKEADFRRAVETAARQAQEEAIAAKVQLAPLKTEFVPLSYIQAAEMITHVNSVLTEGRGKATIDAHNNQLIVTDTEEALVQVREIVKKIDKVTAQVLIEARIVQADKEFSKNLGAKLTIKGSVDSSPLGGVLGYDQAMNNEVASNNNFGFTFTRLGNNGYTLGATLNAMEANNNGRVISSPRVLTMDNKKADIKQGSQVAYAQSDGDSVSTEFKDVDLKLSVTPHVTSDNRVSMVIEITNNDLGGSFGGLPTLTTKEIRTELLVDDGTTLVIGGITKTSHTDDTTGVPGLSKVPALGRLFRNNNESNKTEELLIFITPKIVRLGEEI